MRRDKLISVRVNSGLLEQVNKIIEKNTDTKVYYNHKYYNCKINDYGYSWLSNKLSIADILEKSLQEFIEKYK